MRELADLARTAGAEVVGSDVQRRSDVDPAHFIGMGKVEALRDMKLEGGFDLVICNEDLSPRQQRNLELQVKARVLDRTEIILEIFAQHARTHEGRLQVEAARLHHLLPRLIGAYAYDRQVGGRRGGVGARGGFGEQQIEVERRRIRRRIRDLDPEAAHRPRRSFQGDPGRGHRGGPGHPGPGRKLTRRARAGRDRRTCAGRPGRSGKAARGGDEQGRPAGSSQQAARGQRPVRALPGRRPDLGDPTPGRGRAATGDRSSQPRRRGPARDPRPVRARGRAGRAAQDRRRGAHRIRRGRHQGLGLGASRGCTPVSRLFD
ncbi:MAG: hypothetical protein E6J05_05285 [Chloroflexi bacterium]|nr:MAG: hypothetical protein E6J05_05285 [Chloroflexota bacterium]